MSSNLQLIQSKIYEIRGQKVLLDRDLAELYQVEVRILNQAVKRNIKRFPPDFMFQLAPDEWEILKSQFVISSWGGVRKRPYAFTEQGLAMLSGILNREVFADYNDINEDTRMQLELIHQTLAELQTGNRNLPRPKVGYVK